MLRFLLIVLGILIVWLTLIGGMHQVADATTVTDAVVGNFRILFGILVVLAMLIFGVLGWVFNFFMNATRNKNNFRG